MTDNVNPSWNLIYENCRTEAVTLAVIFQRCFEESVRLLPGPPLEWDDQRWRSKLELPGLVLTGRTERSEFRCVFLSEVLPTWATRPEDELQTQLNLFGEEWATVALGEAETPSELQWHILDPIGEAFEDLDETDPSMVLPFEVWSAEEGEDVPDTATETHVILVLKEAAEPLPTTPAGGDPLLNSSPEGGNDSRALLNRVVNLPVTVVVKLAEKKIEVNQLLELTPGSLVSFNKSCEDLLEMYVNNQVYCQGEAVKIGEKFGLKINTFGLPDPQE